MGKQTQQPIDFQKARKRRRRTATVKRLLILAGLMLLVLGIVLLNNFMVSENITTRLSDIVRGAGGSGYPVQLPGGVIRDLKSNGDHIAVLNNTSLFVYSAKGQLVNNFQGMNDSTVLLSAGSRFLTYDASGKRYALHSRSKTLHEQETEYGLLAAGLNERGDYAIVSSSKQFFCEVNVFNKRFEKVYSCYYVENLVSSVAVSPKGGSMAAGWINARDGVLVGGVDIYRLNSEEIAASCELPDELLLDVQYLQEDRIAVLTDRRYLVLDAAGDEKYSYDFGGRSVLSIERQNKKALLLLQAGDSRERDVVLLDSELAEQGVWHSEEKVVDIALSSRAVYVLGDEKILSFDHNMEPAGTDPVQPVQRVSRIQCAEAKLYYLTREEICVLGAPVKEEEELSESSEEDFFAAEEAGEQSEEDGPEGESS